MQFVIASGGTALHSPVYHLISADLRQPPNASLTTIFANAEMPLLNPELPTLLLFECVLVYMQPAASSSILAWFRDYFGNDNSGPLGAIVYEMFGLEDAFGRVMKNNMKVTICSYLCRTRMWLTCCQIRNVDLPGAEPYSSLSSLPRRFLEHEFSAAHALTLREIRSAYIGREELERCVMPSTRVALSLHYSRISHLEMLDEVEELELVLEHYAVTWGVKLPAAQIDETGGPNCWLEWGLKRAAVD